MRTAPGSLLLLLAAVACTPDYAVNPQDPDVDPGQVMDCDFSPIPGTQLSEYDCNPVFSTTGEPWSDRVRSVSFRSAPVLGHPFYQIWYTAVPEGQADGYGLGYAISAEGTSWEVHPENPLLTHTPGSWDQDVMDNVQVLWDADVGQYVMAWQGITMPQGFDPGRWGIGVATSPDGVTWTRHPANPVLDFLAMGEEAGMGTYVSPCWPLDLTKQNDAFTGYIAGTASQAGVPITNTCDIYTATATDLADWTLGATPVLEAGAWYDAAGIAGAAIVEHEGTWYMFYVGFEQWIQQAGYQTSDRHHLALATSPDGVTWTKHPDNPLPINRASPGVVSAVGAETVGSRIHLWVTDRYEELGAHAVGYYLFEPDVDPHP